MTEEQSIILFAELKSILNEYGIVDPLIIFNGQINSNGNKCIKIEISSCLPKEKGSDKTNKKNKK
jgi:hypothetical protein